MVQPSLPRVIDASPPVVVVDKPAGWVVHASMADEPHDLQAWLSEQGFAGYSPVHRLDRGASGVTVYGGDADVRGAMGTWFADGEVHKVYVCLVFGRPHKKGIIRTPLEGRAAVTRYRQIAVHGRFTLLRVRPETGRTHQIRKHLHGIGHPLVGDERYRSRGFRPVPGYPGRLFLHAASIELPDGRQFEAPLPPELQACVEAVSNGARKSADS